MRLMTLCCLLLVVSMPLSAGDNRQLVQFPDRMRTHMLANMRDHLLALESITRQLAEGRYDSAAELAESRLGMSSMASHGAEHMGPFMPSQMGMIGTEMHRAASRFAIAAKNAAVDGGLEQAFGALSDVMAQCVACHAGFRVH